jgi:hypothetical protein
MTFPIPLEYIVLGGLFLIIVILAIWIFQLENRLRRLCRGTSGADLEDTIEAILNKTSQLIEHQKELERQHGVFEDKLSDSIRGVATVRFNPFKGSGSNQSFATAFINERGDGVVVSSIYSRERVSVFAKPVEEMQSKYELMKEEQEALSRAHTHLG